jgi:hypothetical protein
MYNNAALSQMGKKMPPFKKFLYNELLPKKGIDEDSIRQAIVAHNNRVGVAYGSSS